ncbi:small, acid-soluble spore protein, alpha/beta type [Brevibacillus sp. NRS-1366]
MTRSNRLLHEQAQSALDMLKYEIASEFGIISYTLDLL